jgi:hypothetical protein
MASNNALPATTSIANWNRATRHVDEALRSGRYINAETTLIAAGPPRLADIGGLGANIDVQNPTQTNNILGGGGTPVAGNDALYPIGMIEQFGLQQVQNVQKAYEIGSRRSYQAGGRVQVVGSLGRIMFNGPSLLRALYAYYPNSIQLANGAILDSKNGDSVTRAIASAGAKATDVFPPIFFEPGGRAGIDPEAELPHTFFINLMSELFSHPFGLCVILRDNRNRNYGAFYLEDSMITTHSFQVSSTSTLITEAGSFQCDAAVPIEFSTDVGAQIMQIAAAG